MNDEKTSLEFRIQFCETNLRYLMGEKNPSQSVDAINRNRESIKADKARLEEINKG